MKKYWILLVLTAIGTAVFLTLPFLTSLFIKDAVYVYPTVSDVDNYAVCSGVVAEENGQLIIKANISENDIPYVKEGQQVIITGNALGEEKYNGTVSSISSKATKIQSGTSSRTVIKCDVKIDGDDSKFKVGYNVTAKIIVKTYSDAIVVPYNSVVLDGNNRYVYVIEDKTAIKKYIETDGETPDGFIVSVGIDKNSMVLYDADDLKGDQVRVSARLHNEGY